MFEFVGGKLRTAGPKHDNEALISARLHMDLIGWEIITHQGKMSDGEEKGTQVLAA